MQQKPMRLSYFSVALYPLSGRRAYRGGHNSPAGFLRLTTTGRKSGPPRTVDLIYIRDGSAYMLTATNGGKPSDPGLSFNIRSNPQVSIEVHGTRVPAVAEVAGPEKRRELWARLLEIALFCAGYDRRTHREIPMVIVRPPDADVPGGA